MLFSTVIQNKKIVFILKPRKKAFLSPKNDNFYVHPIKQFPIKGNGLAV